MVSYSREYDNKLVLRDFDKQASNPIQIMENQNFTG